MRTEIEYRQTLRFQLLYEVYAATNGSSTKAVNILHLAADAGIKNGKFKEAAAYLFDEKYLSDELRGVKAILTHKGKKVIEFAVTHPEERQSDFPSFKDMGL